MKKLYLILLSLLFISCSKQADAIKLAEKFVSDNYTNGKPVSYKEPVQFINDAVLKAKTLNIYEDAALNFKSTLINDSAAIKKSRIKDAEIKAIEEGDALKGFYIISVEGYDVVISKDLKVINKPIK